VGGTTLTVGASGGIFGLLGAAFVFGWKQGRALPDDTAAFFRRRLVPWILVNLAIGLLLPFIDNLGHIGGLVTGCLLGMVLDNRVTERPSRPIGVLLAGLSLSLLTIGLWGVSTKWV
jgi:rhomboid protease GluP